MNGEESYITPFAVGEVMSGAAIGVVVDSRATGLQPGDVVAHEHGWREVAVADGRSFSELDPRGLPLSAYLGVLGAPGLTAYVGISEVGQVRETDTVFISGAAGAVGSLAGQVAKLRGARVIGSAGSTEKVGWLRNDLGFDAAFNYKDGNVADLLAAAAPEGIDVFFDNVGGDHLQAAIGAMRTHGRIVLCGAISVHNDEKPTPGPSNLIELIYRRITTHGLLVIDHLDRMPGFLEEVGGWVREERIAFRETFVDGLENMPEALIGLHHGGNIGKMVVRLGGTSA